ncbi:type IX secretion system plug protein domain-containing protein [Winogradskyella litorisediminis]|uniref:Type IX secretion system plug protein domain-containing protein n=1 Tax=Winogradskyella litorisediminis TaxID=1156618 RepID=A0ABW3N647_9FLAO
MIKRFLLFVLIASQSFLVFSQAEEILPPDFIKTIVFKGGTNQAQLPVLRLGQPFSLEFDALNGNEEDFYYKIEHFDFDWKPSQLVKGEYLQGVDNVRILNYLNSQNTFQIYSHYDLAIPNIQTKGLTKSGNYMITIFDDYGEVMFSRKFMIVENVVNVGVQPKRTRNFETIETKQIVNVKINTSNINLNNPLETVKIKIIQNNNLKTAITDLKPQFLTGQELIYRYDNKASFWAGNEYLFFESKNERAATIGIQFIDLKDLYHTYLFKQIPRYNRPYTWNPDINGNFLINAIDVDNVDTDADYTMVHFTLLADEMPDKDVHVYGNFNNFEVENMTRMVYNREANQYETILKLKQGFYNYKFVTVDLDGNLNEGDISGNFWQTENNYKVLVYYRDLGARFDRLIGFGEADSERITN